MGFNSGFKGLMIAISKLVPTQPSQRPTTINVCKTRSCSYSFWAPDDGRCDARNTL